MQIIVAVLLSGTPGGGHDRITLAHIKERVGFSLCMIVFEPFT